MLIITYLAAVGIPKISSISASLPTESRVLHPQNRGFDQSLNTHTNHPQKDELYSPQYPNIPPLWEAALATHKLL
ncbi:MAG: hypothetical protein V7K14_05175 [Nostoc sp.]|uniref:hypothetical protein n=1 Tax=Nostoc sp. NMS7 TaxID=2815391 RepID=UPI0025D2B4FC|nr:hypothetical protein [Nostoc sp. NMS7]MBN3951241.1 hypothetical protein [Nostoc sp. NMS7]